MFVWKTFKNVRLEILLKLYKRIAVQTILYGCRSLTFTEQNMKLIENSEMLEIEIQVKTLEKILQLF